MKNMLEINNVDFSAALVKYRVRQEIRYDDVVKTMDDVEHPIGETRRDIIIFALMPGAAGDNSLYSALMQRPINVQYSTRNNGTQTRDFRLDCDIDDLFLLDNVDGDAIYSGGTITLRALGVS